MYAVHHVADDHGDEHRADVSGEGEAGERREPYADLIADADGQQKKHEALDKARAVGDEALVLAGNVGRKGSRRGGAAGGHRSGTQIVLFDETLGRRAAHQRTGHETERCRRDGNDAAADHARGFKVGAERRRRARAADQSDGAAADTEQRIAPEERHHAAAKEVLQRDHHNGDGKAQDDSFAALEQRGDTDREADGGEEHDHKNGLQRRVEVDGRDAHGIENTVEDGKAQSTDQRSGDAVAAQQRDLVGDDAAQPEQESAQSNGVVHIEFDRQHNDSSFYVSGSARGSHIPLCRVPFQSAV